MSITFAKGASTLVIAAEMHNSFPAQDKELPKSVVLRTKAGILQTDVRKADNPKTFTLNFQKLTLAVYQDLLAWFQNICEGALYKFNYTNTVTGETALPVRWTGGFSFTLANNYYTGTITLEKEIV